MLEYRGYLGVVEADEGAFVGRVAGLRDVVTFEGATYAEVEAAFRASVDDYLAFCADARRAARPALQRQDPLAGGPRNCTAAPLRRPRPRASASISGSRGGWSRR